MKDIGAIKLKNDIAFANYVLKEIKNLGGFTLDGEDLESRNYRSGYQVSIKDMHKIDMSKPPYITGLQLLKDYLYPMVDQNEENYDIGLWLDPETNILYIDYSVNIEDLNGALAKGRELNQISIYGWKEQDLIYLKDIQKESIRTLTVEDIYNVVKHVLVPGATIEDLFDDVEATAWEFANQVVGDHYSEELFMKEYNKALHTLNNVHMHESVIEEATDENRDGWELAKYLYREYDGLNKAQAREVAEYVMDSLDSYILDKEYMDIAWFKTTSGTIINMDDVDFYIHEEYLNTNEYTDEQRDQEFLERLEEQADHILGFMDDYIDLSDTDDSNAAMDYIRDALYANDNLYYSLLPSPEAREDFAYMLADDIGLERIDDMEQFEEAVVINQIPNYIYRGEDYYTEEEVDDAIEEYFAHEYNNRPVPQEVFDYEWEYEVEFLGSLEESVIEEARHKFRLGNIVKIVQKGAPYNSEGLIGKILDRDEDGWFLVQFAEPNEDTEYEGWYEPNHLELVSKRESTIEEGSKKTITLKNIKETSMGYKEAYKLIEELMFKEEEKYVEWVKEWARFQLRITKEFTFEQLVRYLYFHIKPHFPEFDTEEYGAILREEGLISEPATEEEKEEIDTQELSEYLIKKYPQVSKEQAIRLVKWFSLPEERVFFIRDMVHLDMAVFTTSNGTIFDLGEIKWIFRNKKLNTSEAVEKFLEKEESKAGKAVDNGKVLTELEEVVNILEEKFKELNIELSEDDLIEEAEGILYGDYYVVDSAYYNEEEYPNVYITGQGTIIDMSEVEFMVGMKAEELAYDNDETDNIEEQARTINEAPDQFGLPTDEELDAEEQRMKEELDKAMADKRSQRDTARQSAQAKAGEEKARLARVQELLSNLPENPTLEDLFDAFVPQEGHADTLGGEIVRAMNKIGYRWFNDGDYFYRGYGKETAGPAAAFLADQTNEKISDFLESIPDTVYESSDEEETYEYLLGQLEDMILDFVLDSDVLIQPNEYDMLEWDGDSWSDLEPKQEYDFEISDDVMEYVESGYINTWDIIDYFNDQVIPANGQYDNITVDTPWGNGDRHLNLLVNHQGLQEVQDWLYNGVEAFWEDYLESLKEEYGEPTDNEEDDMFEESKQEESYANGPQYLATKGSTAGPKIGTWMPRKASYDQIIDYLSDLGGHLNYNVTALKEDELPKFKDKMTEVLKQAIRKYGKDSDEANSVRSLRNYLIALGY